MALKDEEWRKMILEQPLALILAMALKTKNGGK